jgi:predicted RNA-binding Zn ribbon-like protein
MTNTFEIIAGRLCLDFVNTVNVRPRTDSYRDYLTDYAALLAWSRAAGATTPGTARALATLAATHPGHARRVLCDARDLREELHRVFAALIDGRRPPAAAVARFSTGLATALKHRRLRFRGGTFAYDWPGASERLDSVLWPVLASAAALLSQDDPARLGVCTPPEGCGWLYYDTSKNRSRRWCSMRSCGNAVKARRHYARKRQRRAH